jgi:transforming growth factor-beta-induced protein
MLRRILILLLSLFCTHHAVSGQNLTLREIIDADPDFSTLGQALDAAGIDLGALSAAITLFAPTNAAFSKLDTVLLERLLSTGWSTHLVIVLSMHIIDSALPADLLVAGDYQALNGETLTVTTSGTSKEVSSPNTDGAFVSLPEIVSSEGFLYEVDTVLLPSFVNSSILDIAASDGFSILYELLVLTGLDQLFSSNITATVFAPNNDAFNALGTDALDYYRNNVDVTTKLLSGHVVTNLVVPSIAVNLGPIELPSAAGETLVFSLEEVQPAVFVYLVNGVQVIMADVLANDGIVHVLSGVLAVNGTAVPGTTPAPVDTPVETPVEPPVDVPVEPPVDAPAASPTTEPNSKGKGMKKSKDKESKGMMDKISKGGMDKESKSKDKESKSKGKGSEDSKSKGSEGSSGKGKGGESKGKSKSSD